MKSAAAANTGSLSFTTRYRNELGLAVAILAVVVLAMLFSHRVRMAYLEDLRAGVDYLRHTYLTVRGDETAAAEITVRPMRNAQDILRETSLLGIFALGAAIVIISGGIDLSSGSMIVFSGSICGLVMLLLAPIGEDNMRDARDVGIVAVSIAICATLMVGLMVGTMHAWLITVIRLPPFVATLASLVGLRSLAKIMNQAVTAQLGAQVTKVRADDISFEQLRQWWVAPVVFLVLSLVCWFLMNRTVIGRHLYAMGGNEEAARLSGIRTDLLKWLAYSIGALTAAIAGILYTAKVGAANPSTLAVGYELNAIAAAVVGGCSLQGGVGLIPGVMLGVLFLRVVIDVVAKSVGSGSDDYQGLIVGFLVVLAVGFNELRRHAGGTRKDFFPGLLGILTIPILALLVGGVIFVFFVLKQATQQAGQGIDPRWAGTCAGVIVAAVCALVKYLEVARAKRI